MDVGLASHIRYDANGRAVLVVYKRWQSAIWTPGREARCFEIALDSAWQVEGLSKKDYEMCGVDNMTGEEFAWRTKKCCEGIGMTFGKKPKQKLAQTCIWLMDRISDVLSAKVVAPEKEKKREVGSVDLIVDGQHVKTDPILV